MQNFLFINCKGYTIDQAIIAVHGELMKQIKNPDAPPMKIFSCHFTPGFELPPKGSLMTAEQNPGQPRMIINCTVLLVGDPAVFPTASLDGVVAMPTEEEIKDLSQASSMLKSSTCKHSRLTSRGRKYSVSHQRMIDFAFCLDCGQEVIDTDDLGKDVLGDLK